MFGGKGGAGVGWWVGGGDSARGSGDSGALVGCVVPTSAAPAGVASPRRLAPCWFRRLLSEHPIWGIFFSVFFPRLSPDVTRHLLLYRAPRAPTAAAPLACIVQGLLGVACESQWPATCKRVVR